MINTNSVPFFKKLSYKSSLDQIKDRNDKLDLEWYKTNGVKLF